MPNATGTYEQVDGRPVIRFERTFPHPQARVWDAITDPARLGQWFPTSVEFDELAPGQPISFRFAEDRYPPMSGRFVEVRPPQRLVFTWGDDLLSFDLAQGPGGVSCRLVFSVALDSAEKAARDAAGWDDCLDRLEMTVAGETPDRSWTAESWQTRYDEYRRHGFPATAPLPG